MDPKKLPYKWVYESYLEEGLKHAERRMAMAGYRLADTLVMAFKSQDSEALSQTKKGVKQMLQKQKV